MKNTIHYMSKLPVVLGSGSPRRASLLRAIGIEPTVIVPDVSEVYPSEMPISAIPVYLSRHKASHIIDTHAHLVENHIIITADTIVTIDQDVLGKPVDNNEAKRFLRKLSGRSHSVLSGVCVVYGDKTYDLLSEAVVTFKELSDISIDYYVDNYRPLDKAGAYAIQEYIGMIGIERIDGDYYSIMGLPIQKVYDILIKINDEQPKNIDI